MKTSILVLCLTFSAVVPMSCRRSDTSITRGLERTEQLHSALLQVIPPGTNLASATEFMQKNEFRCSKQSNGNWNDRKNLDFTYCDKNADSRWPVSRRWQVALVDSKGTVQEILVSTGLIGP